MPDPERSRLSSLLAELCQAVGADGGGSLYLDDGDGTLQLAASSTPERGRPSMFEKLRQVGSGTEDGKTLMLRLGGASGGLAILSRRGSGEFTQQDRAVARLYARRFSDDGVVDTAP